MNRLALVFCYSVLCVFVLTILVIGLNLPNQSSLFDQKNAVARQDIGTSEKARAKNNGSIRQQGKILPVLPFSNGQDPNEVEIFNNRQDLLTMQFGMAYDNYQLYEAILSEDVPENEDVPETEDVPENTGLELARITGNIVEKVKPVFVMRVVYFAALPLFTEQFFGTAITVMQGLGRLFFSFSPRGEREEATNRVSELNMSELALEPGGSFLGNLPSLPGGFIKPARGKLYHRINGETFIHTEERAEVVAPFDGLVVFADFVEKRGKMLVIVHRDADGEQSGYSIIYGLDQFLVSREQKVLKGELVGLMGVDKVKGRELGFRLQINETLVSPFLWMDKVL